MFIIKKNWFELLKSEFESESYKSLEAFLNKEYNSKTIYPKPENVFNAINTVPLKDIKVVIIGQDPYHGPNQAHGLCFSVEKDVLIPPSLQNIFKELHNDLNCKIPNNGNLTKWAKQGVLMLNTVLTVEAGKPNSHKNIGWENITTKIIKLVNEKSTPVVFLLWGANAKVFSKYITNPIHLILTSAHPSPMSANQGNWFGNNHFSKTNNYLKINNIDTIDWQIDNIL